jgi:class 3 adenylate cyclase
MRVRRRPNTLSGDPRVPDIQFQIEEPLPVHPFTLLFQDGDVERAYREESLASRLRAFRRQLGIGALVAFTLWIGVENTPGIESVTTETMRVGIGIIMLLVLGALGATHFGPTRRHINATIVSTAVLLCGVVSVCTLYMPTYQAVQYGYALQVLAIFNVMTSHRLPLLVATGASWTISAVYLILIASVIDGISLFRHTGWLFGALILGMLACFQMERFARDAWRKSRLLGEANEKNEELLQNILPPAIADRLKQEERSIADGFANVTVMFADLAGFTNLAHTLPPSELVSFLNEVFSRFDRIAGKHGLEKIKTIGDAYMVAGGIPTPRADHVEAISDMAIEMMDELGRIRTETGMPIEMRIGINSGPVVAGVIGEKKFIYDLWGDTVNIASRMESQGVTGQIQITDATRMHLPSRFVLEPRGEVEIKGKGTMETWFLTGRRRVSDAELETRRRTRDPKDEADPGSRPGS